MQPKTYTYDITTVTYQRRALLTSTVNAELLVQTLLDYREQSRYLLHGFAIMPEHLHVFITPTTGQTIERCIQCIKGGFSHTLRKQFTEKSGSPATTNTQCATQLTFTTS
jgi:putative transposase